MLTGKNKYLPASYNDVPFFVQSVSMSGGHNIRKYEYPGDELGQSKHLSIKLKSYSISAYVFTDSQRDLLLSVLDNATSARTLKHPRYGEIECYVESYSISEQINSESGWVKIDITFVPSGEEDFLQSIKGLIKELSNFINLMKIKINVVKNKLGLLNKPTNFNDKVLLSINNMLNKKKQILGNLPVTPNASSILLTGLLNNLSQLVNSPVNLVTDLNTVSDSIYSDISNYDSIDPEYIFTNDQLIDRLNNNRRALNDLDILLTADGSESIEDLFYLYQFSLLGLLNDIGNLINSNNEIYSFNSYNELYTDISNKLLIYYNILISLQTQSESIYSDIYSNEFELLAKDVKNIKNLYYKIYSSNTEQIETIQTNGDSIIFLAFNNYKNLQDGIDIIERYNNIRQFNNIIGEVRLP